MEQRRALGSPGLRSKGKTGVPSQPLTSHTQEQGFLPYRLRKRLQEGPPSWETGWLGARWAHSRKLSLLVCPLPCGAGTRAAELQCLSPPKLPHSGTPPSGMVSKQAPLRVPSQGQDVFWGRGTGSPTSPSPPPQFQLRRHPPLGLRDAPHLPLVGGPWRCG